MATETAVSDHPPASEESENELKKFETEKVENLEPENPHSVAASLAESGPKIEEKKTEPPIAEEGKKIKTDEKPKAGDVAESTIQKVEDKQAESPLIEEGTKTEGSPITEVAKETVLVPETASNSKPITECKSEEKIATKTAAEAEESKAESVEEKMEELPRKFEESPAAEVETIVPKDLKVSEISESFPSVEERPQSELTEVTVKEPTVLDPVKDVDVETGIDKDVKVSESSESIPSVEEKPLEQSEVIEPTVKEPTLVDPVKYVDIETGINKEDSKLPAEVEAAKEETIVVESSDQVESDTPETKVQEKDVECSPSDKVSKKTVETNEEKIIEPKTNEAETKEKSVVADEPSAECEGDTEKTAELKVISRDIELAPENEKKEETVASGETNIAAEVGDKAEKEETITEAEVKQAKKTPVTETKLEEEKKVDETVKTDVQDSECTKDYEETKTSHDVLKENVPVKSRKQSNSIIKMVKHSLGKAKKAITGKSQNSKAPAASETKDDVIK